MTIFLLCTAVMVLALAIAAVPLLALTIREHRLRPIAADSPHRPDPRR